MAYAKKYSTTFYQLKTYATSGEWQINIYLEGFVGIVTEFDTVRDSIKLDRGGEFDDVIRATTLEFSVYNKSEGQFIEFASADWGDYKVELIYDPNGTPITKYVGYNQTEIYTEPLLQTPYPTSLKFTDGLKHLEYIRWDNSGTLYTGQKALIETLRLALNKLPSPIAVREVVNVYEDSINSTTTDSMLAQIYTDATMYKTLEEELGVDVEKAFMCNEVIEEILKPLYCQIYQSNNKWVIIRKEEYKDTTMYFRDFNANVGTESTLTVNATGSFNPLIAITNNNSIATDIIMPSASAEKEIIPPINRLKLTYNQFNLEYEEANLIVNGDFQSYYQDGNNGVTNNGYPNFWTQSGLNTGNYFAFKWNVNGILNNTGFQFDPASYKLLTYNLTGTAVDYISQSKVSVPTSTSDNIRITYDIETILEYTTSFGPPDYAGFSNWFSNSIEVRNEIYFKIGIYYLAGDNISGYSWSTTAQNAIARMIGGGTNPLAVTSSSTWGTSYYNTFDVILPNLPQIGVYSWDFRFYETQTNVPFYNGFGSVTIDSVYYANIAATYQPGTQDPAIEQILYANINEDENIKEIDVIHGDGTTSISQGSFRLSTGSITDLWNRRGVVENLPILTILINSIRDDNGDFKPQLNATLIGEFENYSTFRVTIGAVSQDYILDAHTQNLETNEWECLLISIKTFTGLTGQDEIATPLSLVQGNTSGNNPITFSSAPVESNNFSIINVSDGSTTTTDESNLYNYN